jgi:hypothetical protein
MLQLLKLENRFYVWDSEGSRSELMIIFRKKSMQTKKKSHHFPKLSTDYKYFGQVLFYTSCKVAGSSPD